MHILCSLPLRQESQAAHRVLLEASVRRLKNSRKKSREIRWKIGRKSRFLDSKCTLGPPGRRKCFTRGHLKPPKGRFEAQNGRFEAILGLRKSQIFAILSISFKNPLKRLENHSTESQFCVTFADFRPRGARSV